MKNIENDFHDFLHGDPVNPPTDIGKSVQNAIRSELSFSPMAVILKLGVVHVFSTLAVLYICPQFGVSWGASSFSLMESFMRLGNQACAALCGVTLVGGTFLIAALLLKPQESFWLKKQMPWIPISLSILTLITLAIMGASGHHTEFVLWSIFAVLGGWTAFEIGRKGKLYSFRIIARIAA